MSNLTFLSQWHLPSGLTALRAIAGLIAIALSRQLTQALPKNPVPRISWSPIEWQSTYQLLFIAGVALPLLPNQTMGPWDTLNPRTIGVLILLIAGISYIGHFAMRGFGNRAGLLATAAIGGLVSSTAVTLSFAQRSVKTHDSPILGAGISLAAAIMAIRVMVEVAVVNRALLPFLMPAFISLAIIPFIATFAIAQRMSPRPNSETLDVDNPLELGAAIFFGLTLALLFVLVKACEEWFGDAGVYLLSAISGLTDVDALSLSLAESTKHTLPPQVGALGIFIGAAVNTLIKGLMALSIGGLTLGKWCTSILLVALALSAITLGMSLWLA